MSKSLEHAFFYRLSSILWKAIVGIIVLLAIYVSAGRFLMSNVELYGDDILRELNHRSPFVIEANRVTGQWHSFTPEIVLSGLRLTVPGSDGLPLELVEGRVAIDVWESLKTRTLQTFRLSLDQLVLQGELTEEGKLLIAGMGGSGGNSAKLLENFLLNILQLNLTNNQFALTLPDGSQRLFDLNLVLRREGSFRRAEVNLVSRATGTEILILAKGVGNPMVADKFSGDLYVNVVESDLQALQQILPRKKSVQLAGEIALQAWLAWDGGEPTIEAELSGKNVTIKRAEDSWQVPLDYLYLKASLMQRSDRWTVFASDLELSRAGDTLQVPRLQLDIHGDSMRVRSASLPLAPINALFQGVDTDSDALAEVFRILDPHGELTSLELNIADYHDPLADWEMAGNFKGVEVQSWNGAPGVKADSGYVRLATDGGFVIVDSHRFSMDFPTVYRDTLRFDDFYGTVYIDWTESDITISSGLMLAEGVEGTARAVFGLNVPLGESKVGLEMDILVGLENTHPIHRTKYVPYILNEALRGWLQSSIGEGRIEEGAFIWRGSLRKDASPLRTVQLFFNIADTNLDYYQGWPSLTGLDGVVLIDDTDVSVWSEKARLYNSSIDFLSAEAWMNDESQMELTITGQVSGDAADGIQVVNSSPLRKIVGDAFVDWTLAGELETRLELQLNLNAPEAAPEVAVETRWNGVDLLINPGDLKLDGITGQLTYSSERGFSSSDLAATVWGKALQAQVRQAATVNAEGAQDFTLPYDAGNSSIEIAMSTDISMASVRQWLNLDFLSLAAGEAPAELLIEVPPGLAPGLTINTDLVGVSLDLPDPWHKPVAARRSLQVDVPLSGDSRALSLALDKELYLRILLSGRGFDGVALGFQQIPEKVIPGTVNVAGHATLVDQNQWQRFLDDYIYPEFVATATVGADADGADAVVADTPADTAAQNTAVPADEAATAAALTTAPDLKIVVDNLRADTLLLYGQDIQDAVFSIENSNGKTRVFGEAAWVRGELLTQEGISPGQLRIEYLDIAGLGQVSIEEGEGGQGGSFELPDLDVVLEELSYDNRVLGGLEFTIRSEQEVLQVDTIVGSFAGLELTPERPGSLAWSQGSDGGKTRVNALLEFQDLGQTLEQLSYQNIIETSSGELDLSLAWPGGPQDFSLAGVQGSLGLDISEGRFLDTPTGASGTLKVVGILNLADIVQRLSLNLSDMFESGIPFHSIDSEVFFHGGSIEVAKMDVKGRSSSFQFAGISDVASQSLDGELIATLPVANNLPWVAALAMGLPVAAGVFVVSKVFEKQVNQFSSAVYRIEGSWEEPLVNFDRIFDISSARKIILPEDAGEADERSVEASDASAPSVEDPADPNTIAPLPVEAAEAL